MLFVTTMETGGLELYILNTLSAIDRQRFKVTIICTGRDSNWYQNELDALGVSVYFCPNPYSQVGFIRRISRLMRDLDTHVVCDFRNDFAASSLYAAKRLNIRSRIAMYRSSQIGFKPTLGRRLYAAALHRGVLWCASRIAGNSRHLMDTRFPNWQNDPRCSVCYNGVDLERFSPGNDGTRVRCEFGISADCTLIGHTGRLHRAKNHSMLLDAFARVHQHNANTHLLLVGDGVEREAIERQISKLSLQSAVTLAGRRKDVADCLAAMDIYCFPSRYEGQPNALIEAAASGKPLVASNIPEIAEIIPAALQPYLVGVDDAETCATSLLKLCQDGEARHICGAAARQFAELDFSLRAGADRLIHLWTADLDDKND